MTTAAILQATPVITDTIISAAFEMRGNAAGYFDASPTDTIISVFSMQGSGQALFVSDAHTIVPSVFSATGFGEAFWNGVADQTGTSDASFIMTGRGDAFFHGVDAAPHDAPIAVRFVSGPEAGVIPVEVMEARGDDVVDVKLWEGGNYAAVFVDPTNPRRKKIFFPET